MNRIGFKTSNQVQEQGPVRQKILTYSVICEYFERCYRALNDVLKPLTANFVAQMKYEPLKRACIPLMSMFIVWLAWAGPVHGAEDIPLSVSRAVNHSYDLLGEGRIDEALDYLLSVKNKGHEHYLIHFALGNCHMRAGQYVKAGEEYLLAVGQSPDYAPAWFNLAKSRYELGDYAKAADAFITAYDRSSEKNATTLYFAGVAFLTANQPGKALDVFDRLMTVHEEEIKPEWKAAKVHALLALKKNREALPLIEDMARTVEGPQKKHWQETLLYQYMLLGMNEKALSYADDLTREDPMEPKWWKGLVHLQLTRDRYREALVALTIYGHLKVPTIEEKRLMADLSTAADIPARSVEILKDILLEKWDTDIVKAVVRNYMSLHQPEEALKWVDKGLTNDAENPDLLMLKGNILFMQKDYAGAARVFKELTRQDVASGRPWLMLGYAAWNMDDIETAYRAMKQAKTYPDQRNQAEKALRSLSALKRAH